VSERAPETTELVYLPQGSWLPPLFALGLLGLLAGVFVWWPYGVIGAAIALPCLVLMFRGTATDVERLPRRQKPTTAVLPPVPPRKPAE
jgi:hypothetical protein